MLFSFSTTNLENSNFANAVILVEDYEDKRLLSR
jgi:hypothetical protein